MLPLQSGNEFHNHSYVMRLSETSEVGEARRFAANFCSALGFDDTRKGRVSIIVNELGNNLVRYAQGGKLIFRRVAGGGLEIIAVDRGPGLDVATVMRDGFTTGQTPGTGLGAVKRQADSFDIFSIREKCTILVAVVFAQDEGANATCSYEVSAVSVPIDGEIVCGDGWAFRCTDNDAELLVADGLGHGILAQEAALEAIAAFAAAPSNSPDQIMQQIHHRLKATRGAAVFLLKAEQTRVSFTGVGNVRSMLLTPDKVRILISQNGTAGVQIRAARVLSETWDSESYVVLHSDGIVSSWDIKFFPGILTRHPAIVCAAIYEFFNRGTDDSTTVAFRRRR